MADEIVAVTPAAIQREAAVPEVNFSNLMALATQLVSTGFLPRAIQTPAQAVAIILTGRELGIGTMQALRAVNVIQGKPALSAELMASLILSKGHRIEWTVNTESEARVKITRRDGSHHEDGFTLEEAQRADLLGKDGWKKYPKAMLRARALSLTARAICPDAIAGVYTYEEMGADTNAEGEIVALPPAAPIYTVVTTGSIGQEPAKAPEKPYTDGKMAPLTSGLAVPGGAPSNGPPVYIGPLRAVRMKSGTTKGKDWSMWIVQGSGDFTAATFDRAVSDLALKCRDQHLEARIVYESGAKGNKIVELGAVSDAAEPPPLEVYDGEEPPF